MTEEPVRPANSGALEQDNSDARRTSPRGVHRIILGTVIAALAPLLGFLGGTMVGTSGLESGIGPMFLWLFIGLFIGGCGAVVAFTGLLRWLQDDRSNH